MTSTLEWSCSDAGIRFTLSSADGPVPVSLWARADPLTVEGQKANVAPLTATIERTVTDKRDAEEVTVSHDEIEALGEAQLAQLGLPTAAPLRIRLRGRGVLTTGDFRFEYQLVRHNGQPLMGVRRTGAIMHAGRERHTLLYPLHSILSEIDAFNETAESADAEKRLFHWARLKELLPESAEVDGQLRTINVVRADAFTLDANSRGEIEPILRHRRSQDPRYQVDGGDAMDSDENAAFEPALPPASQKSFAERFQSASRVSRRYVTRDNWYIALPPAVERALEVVKDYQQRSRGERLAFIANPRRFIADELGDDVSADLLNEIFEETPEFLSQRVRCLGEWQPKTFAYSLPSKNDWFPDEGASGGVLVDFGNQLIPVSTADAEPLRARMQEALDAGAVEIEHGEYRIPVSEESLERIKAATAKYEDTASGIGPEDGPSKQSESSADSYSHEETGGTQPEPEQDARVPLIEDNLEAVGFDHRPHPKRGEPGGLPAVLQTTSLYPHQKDGLRWLQEHWACGSNGALLADDMGLGKTLQTLVFLAWVQEQNERRTASLPFLVVAPTGLLKNWEDEEKRHLARPGLGELCFAYGTRLKEIAQLHKHERKELFARAGWVMTTYETLRDKILLFADVRWGIAAFDEVQKIKNPVSLTHEMAKSVHADFFLALTGTPVENRVSDLWSVIDTIAPGQLRSLKEFQSRYETEVNKSEPEVAANRVAELREALLEKYPPPRILRRMKEQQLTGLPAKHVHPLKESMPTEQAAAYEHVLQTLRSNAERRSSALIALQNLRKVSLSPDDVTNDGLDDNTIRRSARLNATVRELDRIRAAGEKALVFLEYRAFQDHLLAFLQRRYDMERPPSRINGQTTAARRKKIVDEFQASPESEFNVIVLSPKAAGVGLTLTAANHVIHLSRWWNPAVEDQCTDRVFRIGQSKPVHVYYPMAIHPSYPQTSFDTNLDALLERKRSLSSGLLTPADASKKDLNDLLSRSLG
ncbi:DEAD/DEAH box helicase [Salinisphaera sp. LB1]|uniref:DEAD/DEAH box helicase n=1 Tax=Salinisphaera sp. LB1 TaxID=2183911 RepID=UPI000D707193|nr:DEAD/DEAH box helicase [Salinisphaera sp. LB1]AWN14250.1 Patative DNA/RNA helicase SNF2 family [Salinisphaera sp. LB1]